MQRSTRHRRKKFGTVESCIVKSISESLNDIISDAFSHDCAFNDGIPAPSLNRENFNLVNMEAGAEVLNDVEASGELTASFSLCNLSYVQANV